MIRGRASDGVHAAIAAIGCLLALRCSSDGPPEMGDAGHDVVHDTGILHDTGEVHDAGSAEADFASACNGGPPTYAPTYSAIYCEILSQSCALVFCHAGTMDYLVISDQPSGYADLVNAQAMGPTCAPTGLKRVDPGHPDKSLMYLKITSPPCGAKMPLLYGDVSGSLDPQPIEQIRQWIEAGALNN